MPSPAKAASPWIRTTRPRCCGSIFGAVLLGAHAADGDGIDELQVAGVEAQREVDLVPGGVVQSLE